MFLKRLELHGFKTFASGATFEFVPGITAIVGPNGGGKSNLADALRWVTGEQNPRLLRSRKMDDVIFAGSASRAPLGVAEVRLTLDNSDNSLPIEYAEVAVARRLYRSGETEYVINGRKVRLKDVLDLLAHAGLGSDSYLVVGQGMVDAALSLRAGERKSLFEQAADIRRHQIRRHEAQLRLDATERNIERVGDVTGELRPRLRALEKEAQAAREHDTLSERIRELLTIWYSGQWRRVNTALADATQHEAIASATVERQSTLLAKLETQFEQKQSAYAELQRVADRLRRESEALRTQVAQHERELAVVTERHHGLLNRLAESGGEFKRVETQRVKDETAVHVLEDEVSTYEAEESALKARQAQVQAESDDLARRRAALQRDLGAAERDLRQVQADLGSVRGRIAGAGEEALRIQSQFAQCERQVADLDAQVETKAGERAQAARRCASLEADETAVLSRASEMQRALAQAQAHHDAKQRAAAEARREEERFRSQHQVLTNQRHAANETAGVQALMRPDAPDPGQAALGLLSGHIQVERRFERAIEAALEPYLNSLIVESTGYARDGAVHLRKTKAGRAGFITLDSLNGHKPAGQFSDIPEGAQCACELVNSEPRLRRVLEYVLGNVYVVPDIAHALALRPQLPPGGLLVTLEGERIDAAGVWTAPVQSAELGILAKERQLFEISRQLEAAEEKACSLDEEAGAAQAALEPLGTEGETLRKRQAELQTVRRAASSDLNRIERDEALLRQRIELLTAQQADLMRQTESAGQRAQAFNAKVEALIERERALQVTVSDLRRSLSSVSVGAVQAGLIDLRTKAAIAAERRNRAGIELRSRRAALEENTRRAEAIAAKAHESQTQVTAIEGSISALGVAREAVIAQIATLGAQDRTAREKLALLEGDVASTRQQRGAEAAKVASTQNEHRALAAKLRECQAEATALQRQIEGELEGVDLGTAPGTTAQLRMRIGEGDALPDIEVSPAALESARQELGQVRGQLRKLGVVNPLALQEHEEASQRFAFLTAQADDLRKAARSLRRVIRELDDLMDQRFHQTFEKVADEFQNSFCELFGGGTARLSLSAVADEEEPGIEIEVQPPGKRVRDLTLLSGGERALAAVALLFAILKVNPSPVCLLDEVDAMLDEANVGRFHTLLRSLSHRTQFIVITHNRNTMAIAHTLYGVTMGRDHASTVVSLRLADDASDGVKSVVAWQQDQEAAPQRQSRVQGG